MSDHKQVEAALQRLFQEEGRIVFWNDPEREFQNMLPFLRLDGVTTLRPDVEGTLATKIQIEREQPEGKFLVYSPTEEPDFEDDWLLDIRLYSRSFRADRASILLQDLGLENQLLRPHLSERRKFFDAKERLVAMKALVQPGDSALELDRKMIAIVVKAAQPELPTIVQTLFHAWAESGTELDLDSEPDAWTQIEKYDLAAPFWQMIHSFFGYTEEDPSLKNLLLRLYATDFAHHLRGEVPQYLRSQLLPPGSVPNVVVCLAQWRDSQSKASSYDRLSEEVAETLKIDEHLAELEIEQLRDVMTFLLVEKRMASGLRDRVQSTIDTINAEDIRAIATRRQVGHWATLTQAQSVGVPRKALHATYAALVAAAELFMLRNRHQAGFDHPHAAGLYRAYETELFLFDQRYRHFCEAADVAEKANWDILKPLRAEVERCYVNWYLTNLVVSWGKFIQPAGGLLDKWQISDIPNQYRFYQRNVQPWLAESDNKRAFVIISDAFRYEAAHELAAQLNGTYRLAAELTSQLGVLPSYTALGMASLLPHQLLSYKSGTADVLVDGRSSAAGERNSILQSVGGMACKADELMEKKREEGRDFIKEKRVVYIYHDRVDAIGDDAKTEADTFLAVRQAIDELAALINHIVNNLNGHHIVVTADHGFLFAETPPDETNKSKLGEQPKGTLLAKKRYLLGRGLPDREMVWHGKTGVTAQAAGDMEFWVPRGINRFHFVGGARFVHGGAMPQEIIVPVLTVRHRRGKSAQETRIKPVTVQVLGINHRITTALHRFQLLQMDEVSERVKSIKLKVAIYEQDEIISNVETVTFDSASGNMDDRKKWVHLVLQDRAYNKKTQYRLVLRDADTGLEQESVEVIIDRAFTDDF